MDLRITPAQPDDLDACARLLAAAFLEDDVFRFFVRGNQRREQRLRDFFVATLATNAIPAGTLDVARRAPGGEIVGVAEWHAPEPPPGTRVRALRHLPRLVRAIGVRHLRAVSRTEAKFRRFTPREPHWYLAHLAVGPQAQGMGVGGRLLAHRLTLIDAAPVPVYLEATSAGNRRLYERHDFRPVGTIELTPQVHSTAMLRPARPSDGGG